MFIVDSGIASGPDGIIVKHYEDVDPDTHTDEVLAELKAASLEVMEEMAAADEMSGKAWASLKAYMERVKLSTRIGSQYFVDRR